MIFERHIVWPDGHKEIEGVTPKQLTPPSSHSLPIDAVALPQALPEPVTIDNDDDTSST
jgi:hypothetical protein